MRNGSSVSFRRGPTYYGVNYRYRARHNYNSGHWYAWHYGRATVNAYRRPWTRPPVPGTPSRGGVRLRGTEVPKVSSGRVSVEMTFP